MSSAFAHPCTSAKEDQIAADQIAAHQGDRDMEAGSTRQNSPSDPEKRAQGTQLPATPTLPQEQLEQQEEQKLIRRLQMMMNMVMQVIAQDRTLTIDDASQMIADSKKAALAMFPGKELAYDLIWKPRFQRLMRERFRIM
jgi:hypothetical protein